MRVTLKTLKDSRAPDAVGACPTDARFLQLANAAMERLIYEGHWHGTTQRIRFCATDGCITLPPQVAAIEAVAVCGVPVNIRSQWFEFNPAGAGIAYSINNNTSNTGSCCGANTGYCGGSNAIYRGSVCSFSDIQNGNLGNKKLNFTCDLASDVGKRVLVLYYDSNGNWVRTIRDGIYQDGEIVLLAQGTGTSTASFASALTGVQFLDDRDGLCWAYELNTDTSTRRMIGLYQSFETLPDYPRYFFPGISTGTTTGGSCVQTLVEAEVKLNYVPVKNDSDWLCVPCVPAVMEMMQALNSSEHEPDGVKRNQIIMSGLATAKQILQSQTQHFTGDGMVIVPKVVGSNINEIDPVPCLL